MQTFIIVPLDKEHTVGVALNPVSVSNSTDWVQSQNLPFHGNTNLHVWYKEGEAISNTQGMLPINLLNNFTYCGQFVLDGDEYRFLASPEAPPSLIDAVNKVKIVKSALEEKPTIVKKIEEKAKAPSLNFLKMYLQSFKESYPLVIRLGLHKSIKIGTEHQNN